MTKGITWRLFAGVLLCLPASLLLAQQADEPAPVAQSSPALVALSQEFRDWLRRNGPVEPFASNRLRRPPNWQPDWSQSAIQARKSDYLRFQARLDALAPETMETPNRVDAALLGAAMERVHWQLEVLNRPSRDPGFYLDQALGSLFDILLETPQPSALQLEEIIRRLHRFPALVNSAKLNLDAVAPELAMATARRIGDVDVLADALDSALSPGVPANMSSDFETGLRAMRQSMASFQDWLLVSGSRFTQSPSIGAQKYRWYLGHVALAPQPPETLAAEAELALAGIGASLAVSRHRSRERPAPSPFDQSGRMVQMADISRAEITAFLQTSGLVSPDPDRPGLELAPMPSTLAPMAFVGEALTFHRDGATRYLHANREQAGLVESMAWVEPRLLLTWDGTPGRWAQQLSASTHPSELRRNAISPAMSNGLALYFNEQIRDAGLYTFSPASAELSLEINRVGATLALADLHVALDGWNAEQAQNFLVERGGLSEARAQAAYENLVAYPGLAGASFAAYSQLLRYLADASLEAGDAFSLTDFNDRLLRNANVPVTLQRWETLGSERLLEDLETQRGKQATVPE